MSELDDIKVYGETDVGWCRLTLPNETVDEDVYKRQIQHSLQAGVVAEVASRVGNSARKQKVSFTVIK